LEPYLILGSIPILALMIWLRDRAADLRASHGRPAEASGLRWATRVGLILVIGISLARMTAELGGGGASAIPGKTHIEVRSWSLELGRPETETLIRRPTAEPAAVFVGLQELTHDPAREIRADPVLAAHY